MNWWLIRGFSTVGPFWCDMAQAKMLAMGIKGWAQGSEAAMGQPGGADLDSRGPTQLFKWTGKAWALDSTVPPAYGPGAHD
jgi:hypothetical protein